ncbi:MAG: SpoIIE family protein phosphatase [Gemmataceae bacterium]
MTTEPASLLVVEDNPVTGDLLSRWLRGRGHEVAVCADGKRALELTASNSYDLVLLDVGVPGADGFEVLQAIRVTRPATALPVVMATAHGHSEMVVRALELGANDYVTKPYDPAVLLARVQTQLSIKRLVEQQTRLERSLADRNEALERANRQLCEANRRMKADLQAAARIQEALLPPPDTEVPGARLAWAFRPCEHLAGDTLNAFPLGRDHLALYVLDVTGHGVPAALLSVHLSLTLSPARDLSALVRRGEPVSPAEVVGSLNSRFAWATTERYFTLFYGVLDLRAGRLRYACAGHPGPAHLNGETGCRFLPPSGPPVGVIEHSYQQHALVLAPGDRLYLYSDGLPEAADAAGELYGKDRLAALVGRFRAGPLGDSLAALVADVEAWSGGQPRDDLSALAVEFTGRGAG